MIANVLTMLWYNPNLDTDCPPWVYLTWAIGLFLYQTFDAVDGTQARRTRQSGPLGELFDHGQLGHPRIQTELIGSKVWTHATLVSRSFFSQLP